MPTKCWKLYVERSCSLDKLCKCGCGEKIIITAHHKYVGIPNFIRGHSTRVLSKDQLKKRSESAKKRTAEGRNKVFIGWWNGKERSPEQKAKQSKKMSGENHPFYGKKRPEHSKVMSALYKQNDNHVFKCPIAREKAKQNHPDFSGKNHPRYIDGRNSDPAFTAAYVGNRRAMKLEQTPENADLEKILEIYKECRRLNQEHPNGRGRAAFHVDHIMPLSRGGLHHEDNLRVIPAEENLRKHAKIIAREEV